MENRTKETKWKAQSDHALEAAAGIPLFDAMGQVCRIVKTTPETKPAERLAPMLPHLVGDQQEKPGLLTAALTQMPVGIIIVDVPDGRIALQNHKAMELLGSSKLAPNFSKSTGHAELPDKGRRSQIEEYPVCRAMLGETVLGCEMDYHRGDGQNMQLSMDAIPLRNDKGEAIAAMLTFQDISQKKRAEADRESLIWELSCRTKRLQAAKEQSESANEAKSQFLAYMSHEIRTPLAAILGFAELLRHADLAKDQSAEFINTIIRNGQNLERLIEDILDLSKMEAGKLEVENVEVSINTLLLDVQNLLVKKALDKGISLTFEVAHGLPDKVLTDPNRLRQILINLIANAIKFTNHGGVSILVSFSLQGVGPDQKASLEFQIMDTGVGIDPKQQRQLFKPFSQGSASTARQFGGTGLGLMISRRLAQLLGGDLVLAKSSVGQGSVFVVTTSVKVLGSVEEKKLKPVQAKAVNPNLDGISVLVTDDSVDNQIVARMMLKRNGASVETACNGEEAITKALTGSYDIILMDIQMPLIDGHEATRELRKRGYSKPIIALTAFAMKEERERCLRSGFTDHIAKPLSASSLVRMVIKHTRLTEKHQHLH